jgi:ferritin-like metal-binding protein YciE
MPAAEIMDAGLIAAAQRMEHHEKAGLRHRPDLSELLGEDEAVELLAKL